MKKKTIPLNNGETLAYIERNPQAKQTILLIHGNMSSGVHYKPLIEELKQEYHLVVPDLRGFGDSTYHKPIETLEDFADDLYRFLDEISVDAAHVVGWSTGGGVALKFAAKYPHRTETVSLIESASYRGYPIFEKDENFKPTEKLYVSKEAMANDPVQVAPPQKALENKDKPFMKKIWDQLIFNVKQPEENDYACYLEETLKQRNLIDVDWALMTFNMSHTQNGVVPGDASIDEVQAPVLSIYGTKDLVILKTMFEETVSALPNATPYIIDGGSHAPLTDDPQLIADLIVTHINTN